MAVAPPTKFDFSVLRQQNVLAFDVTVDDVMGVQVGQTLVGREMEGGGGVSGVENGRAGGGGGGGISP